MPLTPTPQQQAVLDLVAGDCCNVAVNAVAGASKTTTAIWAASRAGPDCGFVAFSAAIAEEMRSRLNGSCQASTMHSLGFRMLKRTFDMADNPDPSKCRRHFEREFPNLHQAGRGKWKDRQFPKTGFEAVPQIVSLCKLLQLDPSEDRGHVLSACDDLDVELPDDYTQILQCLDAAGVLLSTTLEDRSCCDFDDMLAMPLYHRLARRQFATLFVDEAQDLNPLQHRFVQQLADRYIVVGDPAQAIFGFCGADSNSFATLRDRLGLAFEGCTELPLTWTFRCPTTHTQLAALLVPHFESRPGADTGNVGDLAGDQALPLIQPGDMVVCRNNAPLTSLAYRLIQAGKPVMVRGRALGEGLAGLVKRLEGEDLEDLQDSLDAWEAKRVRKLEKREALSSSIQEVRDRAACLRHLIQGVQDRDQLLERIDTLFADSDPVGKIVLSSVHRAKGLERPRIFIWEPGLMPGSSDPQERNLLYVALTRSKSELYLVDDKVHRKNPTREWLERIAGGSTRRELTER